MPDSVLQALLNISKIELKEDLDQILTEILAIVSRQIDGHSGSMMLVNEETGELEMAATFGLPDDYIDRVYERGVPITCSPSGEVLKTGEYYVVSNIFKEPRDKWWADLAREFGFSAQLFMPIIHKSEVIGLLNIYMAEPHDYTHNEVTFVSIAASQAAAVIEKARLYQHVLEKKKELEAEIRERKRLEESLQTKEQLLEKLFALSPIGVGLVEFDPGGMNDRKLSWANKAMMALFGFKADKLEYLGQSSEVIYASREEFERASKLFSEKLKKGELAEVEAKLKRRDGSIFDGYITLSFLDPSKLGKGLVSTISDITVRKQAEEQLRTSEEKFRTFMETARDLMHITDKDGNFTYVSESLATTLGYSKEELLGKHITHILTKKTVSENFESRWKTIVTKGELTLDALWVTKDGKEIYGELKVVAIYDEDGTFTGSRAVFHDITERKRMEEELQRSEALYRTLFEATGAPTLILDGDGTFYRVNEEGAKLSGFTKEELEGKKSWTEFIAKKEDLEMMKEIHRLRRTDPDKVPKNYEFLFKGRYGNLRNIYVTAAMIPGTERSVVSFADLTERKKAEKALQASEEYYRSLIENALDGVMIVDERGNLQYQSPSVEHILGYKREERVGMSLYDNIHPEDKLRSTEAFSQLLHEKGLIQDLDLRIRHKYGSWRTISGRAKNLLDTPAVRGIVINFHDITDRKRADEALRESEEKYRLLVENANEGIIVAQDGMLKFVNPQIVKATGYSNEELVSKPLINLVHPDDQEMVLEYHHKRLQGEEIPVNYAFKVVDKGGKILCAELKSVVILWEGRPATLNFISDVTERKKAEDALRAKEQEQQLILNSVPLGIFHLDTDSNYIHVNKVLAERHGCPSEYFIGKSTRDIFPGDADGYIKNDREILESGKPQISVRTKTNTPEGERWMRLDKVPLKDAEGNVIGIIGFELDITDRKLAEDALRKSEEKYRTLVENIQDGVFILQGNPPRLVFCNEAFAGMVGYTVDEAMELGFDEYVAPEDLARVASRYRQRQAGEDVSQEYEYCALHKDGKTRVCVNMNVGLIEYHGKVASLGTIKNVTERRLAEQALKESGKKLSQIVQGSPIASFVIDKNHFITCWNTVCERLTGISAAKMVGTKNQWQVFYPEKRPIMADFVVDNQSEDAIASMYGNIYRRSDLVEGAYEGLDFFPSFGDSGKWLLFTAAPLKDSNGRITGALETLLDLTELKRAEEQIQASLNEKKLLLQEIHHRVKNNMQVISSLLSLLSRRVKNENELTLFKDTQARIKSMALVHEKLYRSGDIAKIDFADYIRSLTSNLFDSYSVNTNDIKLTSDIHGVFLDINTAVPCGLLINELISNALKHAFPNGKTGEITVTMHPLDGDEVELIVRDTGIGFPEALDFRNTESLGMQLIVPLVEGQLDGSIELDRSAGTVFKIKFRKGTNAVI